MPKIIKPVWIVPSKEVVKIPDAAPTPSSPAPPMLSEQAEEEEACEENAEPALVNPKDILLEETVERANDVAQKIIQYARAEREELLEQARADAQRIREEAGREAYRQVLEEKEKEIAASLTKVDGLLDDLKQQQSSFLKQYEDGICSLVLDIAKKVLCASIQEHKELMIPLVKEAVNSLKNADWISVQVSERLLDVVGALREEFARCPGYEHVEVTAADIPQDSCIINTPDGMVDASVSVQMENLKTQLEKSRR